MRRRYEQDPELEAKLDAMNPMGRIGDPRPTSARSRVLASEDSRYFTGNTSSSTAAHINGSPWQPSTWNQEQRDCLEQ
jgi:hypothetical protein